jgi:hypothetical protein
MSKRDTSVNVRLTSKEREALQHLADRDQRTLSDYIRVVLQNHMRAAPRPVRWPDPDLRPTIGVAHAAEQAVLGHAAAELAREPIHTTQPAVPRRPDAAPQPAPQQALADEQAAVQQALAEGQAALKQTTAQIELALEQKYRRKNRLLERQLHVERERALSLERVVDEQLRANRELRDRLAARQSPLKRA